MAARLRFSEEMGALSAVLIRMKPSLTIQALMSEAKAFSDLESAHSEPSLFGVTDGKAVGTYLEHKFVAHLLDKYVFLGGNSALGIDLPSVETDIKVTSVRQPQSSCPFKSARQKVYGLGYNLIVFVYDKHDDHGAKTARLDMKHTVFISSSQTGDYQLTRLIRDMLDRDANSEDLLALMADKNLPLDDIQATALADEILSRRPAQGYLTISNALQWRLQYGHAINKAGQVEGVRRIR